MKWTNFKNTETDFFFKKEQSTYQNTVAMNFKTIFCVVILGGNLVEMLERQLPGEMIGVSKQQTKALQYPRLDNYSKNKETEN